MQTTIFDFLYEIQPLKNNDPLVLAYIKCVSFEYQESRNKPEYFQYQDYLIEKWQKPHYFSDGTKGFIPITCIYKQIENGFASYIDSNEREKILAVVSA